MRKYQLVVAALAAAVIILVPLVLLALQPLSVRKPRNVPVKETETDNEPLPETHARVEQLEQQLADLNARVETLETLRLQEGPPDLSGTPTAPMPSQPQAQAAAAAEATARSSPPPQAGTLPPDQVTPAPAESLPANPGYLQAMAAPGGKTAEPGLDPTDGGGPGTADVLPVAEGEPRETAPKGEPKVAAAEQEQEPQLVDIKIVSHPERAVVPRVADIVAQTNANGWPVVLVRSELADESWWAQQSVGRRGQYIAARVHFGNQASAAGSWFRMVILLLGTPEEAVRFQTARQFQDIPKGIPRSKEFRYVRQ